jgi:hypothetical protein
MMPRQLEKKGNESEISDQHSFINYYSENNNSLFRDSVLGMPAVADTSVVELFLDSSTCIGSVWPSLGESSLREDALSTWKEQNSLACDDIQILKQ